MPEKYTRSPNMRHETYIDVLKSVFLTVVCLISFPLLLSSAVDVSRSRDIETSDVVSDDVDSVPEWYVPAEIPDSLKAPFGAPLRAAAAACLTDSVLTFNIDSVLTEATTYDYDAAGRTIRTTVWQYNADGTRTGKSKQEYAFDANGTQIYTGTFAWDATTNDWKGTSKSEFVYNEAHQMESNITYTWVNNTWLPSQALTYAYDAAGRETEFTTYARNASLNRLVPSKQRLQTWYNASKKTLEINYTAYSNGAWSAGNKKEYDYDANGNQIEYTYYASYSGGNWVGSTHELWTYNAANKKTYYEKQTWSNGAWSNTSKEVYAYNAKNKQTLKIVYTGSGTTWTESTKDENSYNDAGKTTLSAKYTWKNGAWKGKGQRTETTYTTTGKTATLTYSDWDTNLGDWCYASLCHYHYDNAGRVQSDTTFTRVDSAWQYYSLVTHAFDDKGNDTLSVTSGWNGSEWVATSITKGTYIYNTADDPLLVEIYTGLNDSWTGQQKVEYSYNAAGSQTLYLSYDWYNGNWRYKMKNTKGYDADNHLILSESYLWKNSAWAGSSKYEYAYDTNGRQNMSAQYLWSNNAWKGLSKTVQTFDSDGTLLSSISFSWIETAWEGIFKYDYVYDDAGRTTERLISRFNNNTWVNDQRYTTAYDTRGQEVTTCEYRWVNSTWLMVSLRDKTFDASDNKLRRDINGSWSTMGTLSSYTDVCYFYACDTPADNNGAQPRTPTELEEIDENNGNYENDDTNVQPFDPMRPAYNLQGQSVDPATYHGIVIQNGKKYVL